MLLTYHRKLGAGISYIKVQIRSVAQANSSPYFNMVAVTKMRSAYPI